MIFTFRITWKTWRYRWVKGEDFNGHPVNEKHYFVLTRRRECRGHCGHCSLSQVIYKVYTCPSKGVWGPQKKVEYKKVNMPRKYVNSAQLKVWKKYQLSGNAAFGVLSLLRNFPQIVIEDAPLMQETVQRTADQNHFITRTNTIPIVIRDPPKQCQSAAKYSFSPLGWSLPWGFGRILKSVYRI